MFYVSEDDVRSHVSITAVTEAIAEAFVALDQGLSAIFPVVRGWGSDPTHFYGVKSGRDGGCGLLGTKMGSYNPSNRERGLPAHLSNTMLFDDVTGMPVAVVAASYLNGMRTAAVNALAVRMLARPDAWQLGVIGTGGQSIFEIDAVVRERPIGRILAHARTRLGSEAFVEEVRRRTGIEPELVDARTAAGCDILVTVTPANRPVIEQGWVRPGTHISAMGADNIGKMELPVDLVRASALYVDLPEQAVVIGETQHLAKAGFVTAAQLADRTLGALLTGRAKPRTDASQITIFDSSGIAIQDIAAAHRAYRIMLAKRHPRPDPRRPRVTP
jgi:alanine dehydrogenase